VAALQTTTSTTFADLATLGPSVTLTLPAGSTKALVIVTAAENTNQGGASAYMSVAVTGASTVAASDATAFIVVGSNAVRASATAVLTGLSSAGPLTFTAKYRVSAGTGTFAARDITVIPLP
jgi:hypothetical protein